MGLENSVKGFLNLEKENNKGVILSGGYMI